MLQIKLAKHGIEFSPRKEIQELARWIPARLTVVVQAITYRKRAPGAQRMNEDHAVAIGHRLRVCQPMTVGRKSVVGDLSRFGGVNLATNEGDHIQRVQPHGLVGEGDPLAVGRTNGREQPRFAVFGHE